MIRVFLKKKKKKMKRECVLKINTKWLDIMNDLLQETAQGNYWPNRFFSSVLKNLLIVLIDHLICKIKFMHFE